MKIEKSRLGSFFLFIGLILLMIFFFTDQAKYPSYGYFFVGATLMFLGGYLWWRDRKPAPESGRFRSIRRMRQKRTERIERKKRKKEEREARQQ
jgi:hypothetical protein